MVYDYAYVDSTSELTIEPGTRIYFHKGAGLYVKGKIIANGTLQEQIQFLPDRLEDSYKNVPDQWNGIVLFSGSHDNIFNFCTIKNANIGLAGWNTLKMKDLHRLNLQTAKLKIWLMPDCLH